MARKRFTTFNLSFLDIMSCGFGAVVLFYMIISAQVSVRADKENIVKQKHSICPSWMSFVAGSVR